MAPNTSSEVAVTLETRGKWFLRRQADLPAVCMPCKVKTMPIGRSIGYLWRVNECDTVSIGRGFERRMGGFGFKTIDVVESRYVQVVSTARKGNCLIQ
jgi:hypothetical protein